MSSGASNLGPESIVDTPADPSQVAAGKSASDAGFKPSLLTQVCTRSAAVGQLRVWTGHVRSAQAAAWARCCR